MKTIVRIEEIHINEEKIKANRILITIIITVENMATIIRNKRFTLNQLKNHMRAKAFMQMKKILDALIESTLQIHMSEEGRYDLIIKMFNLIK